MLAVHVVWGGTLGILSDRTTGALEPVGAGRLADAERRSGRDPRESL